MSGLGTWGSLAPPQFHQKRSGSGGRELKPDPGVGGLGSRGNPLALLMAERWFLSVGHACGWGISSPPTSSRS